MPIFKTITTASLVVRQGTVLEIEMLLLLKGSLLSMSILRHAAVLGGSWH